MSDYFDTGFSVREVPWHGKGLVADTHPENWAEARTWAGLDWEPISEPMFRRQLVGMDQGGQPVYTHAEVPGHQLITRSDNGGVLASAKGTYEIINHAQMGEIVDAVLQLPDVKYETAGATHAGSRVWALAQLGEPVEIPGDSSPLIRYMAVLNAHDGSASLKVVGTGVRIVCANTWHAADVQAEKSGTAYSFRHTSGWKDRVEEARLAVTGAYAHMDAYIARAKELIALRFDREMENQFIRQYAIARTLRNTNTKRANLEDYLKTNTRVRNSFEETVSGLKAVLNSRTCNELDPTAYRLVQAAGEFEDHIVKFRNNDTYVNRTLFDTSNGKKDATSIVRELAHV